MSGRTTRTMIARAFGEEIEYKTAGGYSFAGVVIIPDGERNFPVEVVAVGHSHASVLKRTRTISRRLRSRLHKSDESRVMQVVPLIEATAPVARDYFGTHDLVIDSIYKPGGETGSGMYPGWITPTGARYVSAGYHGAVIHTLMASRTIIRHLAEEGYAALSLRPRNGTRTADFQMTELLKRAKPAKKAA